MPANIIVFTANRSSAAANHWITQNCPHFFQPGHDILYTQNPTPEQLASNAAIIVPDPQDYYVLLCREWHIRNVIVLGTPIDLRDTQTGAGRVRAAVGWLNGLLIHSLKVGEDLATQNTALKARVAELEKEKIVTLESTPNDKHHPLAEAYALEEAELERLEEMENERKTPLIRMSLVSHDGNHDVAIQNVRGGPVDIEMVRADNDPNTADVRTLYSGEAAASINFRIVEKTGSTSASSNIAQMLASGAPDASDAPAATTAPPTPAKAKGGKKKGGQP